ncbi:MAG: EutN/CcmL family microcompartment protein [Planctomycetota bacterium]
MQPANVIGHAEATHKHESLRGQRLVIAQPFGPNNQADGAPLLVLDDLGCRIGDRVMLTSDGTHVQHVTKSKTCPARWCVCGLLDE